MIGNSNYLRNNNKIRLTRLGELYIPKSILKLLKIPITKYAYVYKSYHQNTIGIELSKTNDLINPHNVREEQSNVKVFIKDFLLRCKLQVPDKSVLYDYRFENNMIIIEL